ncbi:hypothetical protein C8J57DRAFT_1006721, partial [Mycena rebaudengoi]
PRISDTTPYNLFYVDIFQLGRPSVKFQRAQLDSIRHFRPVAESMTVTDPSDRPTAAAALVHLRTLSSSLTPSQLDEQIW